MGMNGWLDYDKILKHPHILVAGTTGSGKSTVLDGMIWTITANDETCAEMILIDPKRIDLRKWKDLPHTLRYETEVKGALSALDEVIRRMESRYKKMAKRPDIKWRHLYVVIDELADLMLTSKKVVLPRLQRIAQLGRACNIHLLMATQAPSRLVIPAELVLNITDRIALRCQAAIESRQIINQAGAESLPAHGKGLWLSCDGLTELGLPLTPKELIDERIEYWNGKKGFRWF